MQAHTDSNKANNETSTDQHADRCMQTLTECTAAVRDWWPRPQIIWSCRDRHVIYSMRGRSRRIIMMIGRSSFIGLIPRRWITIAAIQWQFLATLNIQVWMLCSEVPPQVHLRPEAHRAASSWGWLPSIHFGHLDVHISVFPACGPFLCAFSENQTSSLSCRVGTDLFGFFPEVTWAGHRLVILHSGALYD